MEQNETRIVYRTAWRSFYGRWALMILIAALACVGSVWGVVADHLSLKWLWIIVAVVEVFIFLAIAIKRATMCLILKDDPDRPENQEVEYISTHPLKLFTEFRVSKEIGLTKIADIDVKQNALQTLFKIGDVIISSPGTSEKEVKAMNIPHPRDVRDEIQKHARKYTMSRPRVAAPTPAPEQDAPAPEV